MTDTPLSGAARSAPAGRRWRVDGWAAGAFVIAAAVMTPVLAVLANLFQPSDGAWAHLAATVLPEYLRNTAGLVAGVGIGTVVIGTGTAWLVTMCRFPGSRLFEWALLLPLAFPAYVLAYTYADLLQFAGPVQTGLRDLFGWQRGDYWFPEIQSLGGAVALLTLAFYPYVYLLARAAFHEQSICVLEVSRTLGCTPWAGFRRVALPLARPAIVAGVALALMETVAEFGAVQHLGVGTFTTGIYRTWFGMGNRIASAQLASVLLLVVLAVFVLERFSRGPGRYHHTSTRYRPLAPARLRGAAAAGAVLACLLPLGLGFLLPFAALLEMSLTQGDPLFGARFAGYAWNSLRLAGTAAVLTVAVALVLAYGLRLAPGRLNRAAVRLATIGYAVPGSVIAVGVLIPLGGLDRLIDAWAERVFGVSTGLLLSGTVVALLFAYLARFLAVAFNGVETGLQRVRPSMDHAARTLGCGPGATLRRVHVPLMAGSVMTAALLAFVEVLKELPATLIVRPFNLDTLAVRVYQLASDERLAQASTGALAIVLVGLVPVIVLSRLVARARPGSVPAPITDVVADA